MSTGDLALPPLWEALTFLAPTSDARADGVARWLAEDLGDGTVVDVGCGWAELLLRVTVRAPHCRAVGVDAEPTRVGRGRRTAAERGLADRVELRVGPGHELLRSTPVPAAVVASGVSQVWGTESDEARPLDYAAALGALRAAVGRGARVYFAEAIWSRPPTDAAVAHLSGLPEEFLSLADLLDLAVASGFAVVAAGESTQEEWDDFESGFNARHATWLAAHEPDHPDAAEVRERAERQRAAYVRGYRGVLGFAHLRLLAV